MTENSSDDVWEAKYAAGHRQTYPWDIVVSFVFRYRPKQREATQTTILELGCGTGANLWFAAREGFRVFGIECSESAVKAAKTRFTNDGLSGGFVVGDLVQLPFAEGTFDLIIDRAAITCVSGQCQEQALAEAHRVMKQGGVMLSNRYASDHDSAKNGRVLDNGCVSDIEGGSLTGVGQICFSSHDQLLEQYSGEWELLSLAKTDKREYVGRGSGLHSEWSVVSRKTVSR